ncbi:phenolphthiocerol synthesis polyketide synthase type I Pks15/1 [Folsomia candida]|uniref:phenolphthiocerol synthesis polyketide synthase type I Pks15/1 n=1 Tax=Folsomia candida TaxID=158441 RepID=UPI000B908885|nr:phenolphthiocerol synthesis polyketide synthase type I Pks15/1 [Folsomia candida]
MFRYVKGAQREAGGKSKEPIAIVGVAFRLPGANNRHTLWGNLMSAKDSVGLVPSNRWTKEKGCRRLKKESVPIKAGFIDWDVGKFDANFWGLSPLELGFIDPQARLMLQLSWEALEDAGIPPYSLRGTSSSVHVGSWRDEYKDLMLSSGSTEGGEELRRYLGCSIGNAAARIAQFFRITGPTEGIEAGCSSSFCAIDAAIRHLRSGRSNLALAGGANLIVKPYEYHDFQGVLSPAGRCKVYQADADGFARADGGIIYVLKRVSDAIKDGDHILGVIKGSGCSQDTLSRNVGTPTVEGESAAMLLALADAEVNPVDIDWVEMHGTGTRVGDPVEVASTRLAYQISSGERTRPLIITSIKANIGHTESVSGGAGLLKVLLSMEHESIPPQLLTADLNPEIDFKGLIIPRESLGWKGELAGVSSFGISGTNTHLIVERVRQLPTEISNLPFNKRVPLYILPISAKSATALTDLRNKHAEALELLVEQDGDDLLAAYCYSAATCRHHFDEYRSVSMGSNRSDLIEALRLDNSESVGRKKPKGNSTAGHTPISFLFPGEGCQYVGMGLELYDSCSSYRRHFDEVNSLFIQFTGINLLEWLKGDTHIPLCPLLCTFAVEYSLFNMWIEWGVKPNLCVVGHSSGEVAAATAVGELDLATAVQLMASLRKNVLETMESGRMVVLMADESLTRKMIQEYSSIYILGNKSEEDWIDIAAFNSSNQTVVSGPKETMEKFATYVRTNYAIKSTLINHVNHAYHSRSFEKGSTVFKMELDKLAFSTRHRSVEYISSTYGRKLEDSEDLGAAYWSRCFKQPVKFIESSVAATAVLGARLFLEISPQPAISPIMVKNCSDPELVCIPSIRRNVPNWTTLSEAIATLYLHRVELDWTQIWTSLVGVNILHKKVPHLLPTYPFQNEGPFWFNTSAIQRCEAGVRYKSKIIHPLLGLMFPVAQCGITNRMSVFETSTEDLLDRAGSWLRDHKIGPHNIFPAAGYMEMGFAVVTTLSIGKEKLCGINLSDIVIKTVLSLDVMSVIQTNVIYDGEMFNICISSRRETENSGWQLHASLNAKVVQPGFGSLNQEEYLENFTGASMPSPYIEMSDLGYKFGPQFKSLVNLKSSNLPASCSVTADVTPPTLEHDRDEVGSFVVHPTLLDALIQAALIAQPGPLATLRVPIKISSVDVLSHHIAGDNLEPICDHQLRVQAGLNSSTLFVHGNDSVWHAQVSITNLTTINTTVEAIQRMTNVRTNTNNRAEEDNVLPLFIEEWTAENKLNIISMSSTGIHEQFSTFKAISRNSEEIQEYKRIASYIRTRIAVTLKLLGFCFLPYESFTLGEIASRLGLCHIAPAFLARLLHYAGQAGLLNEVSATEYVALPHSDFGMTENPLHHKDSILRDDWAFTEFYISKLDNFLRGTESILHHLFPPSLPTLEQPTGNVNSQTVSIPDFSAERLYRTTVLCSTLTENLISIFATFMKNNYTGLRILEVGAGTGAATRELLHYLHGSSSTYTFTDISTNFLNRAEDSLPHVPGVEVDFRILDVEKDVLAQGFEKEAFDVIIAMNVLHATTDLGKVLGNLRLLLRQGGNIFVAEQLRPCAFIDIVFGHCKGYWLFKDDVRSGHCLIDGEAWKVSLQSAGYKKVSIVENTDFDVGVIIATANEDEPSPFLIISTTDDDDFADQLQASNNGHGTRCNINNQKIYVQPGDKIVYCFPHSHTYYTRELNQEREQLKHFLAFSQALLSIGKVEIFLVSHGIMPIRDEEDRYPVAGAIRGFSRSLANEMLELDIVWIDLDNDEDANQRANEIIMEIKNRQKLRGRSEEPFVAYRGGVRHVGKFAPFVSPFATLPLSQTENPVQLRLPQSCALEDLQWDYSTTLGPEKSFPDDHIQIRVHASGLNFRDILSIRKPTLEFASASAIGSDICGEVIAVGSAVRGICVGANVLAMSLEPLPLPNVVHINASHVALLPQNLTHVEGATLPTAFYTVYHSLVTVGNLSRGEWVLIHTASGGVGLVAIQIAREIGANIVCTAGSRRKRAYLTDILGLKNVTSSRDIPRFLAGVKTATDNAGVHLVLNSLTSKGWKEASISVTKTGGRFIEMSKLNVWTHAEVEQLRPDVKYSIVDLSSRDEERTVYLAHEMETWLAHGKLLPIAYSVFEPAAIISALGHLQSAAHIGKVVIRWTENIFNDRSTYLLTGGCGALGIELAKLMLANGAKHLVLVSRRHDGREAVVSKLKDRDGHSSYADDKLGSVVVEYGDISTRAGVDEILGKISSFGMPSLRGIFHVAGTLSDATIPNMTMEKIDLVWTGKVDGAWALHAATSHLNLEHFVLYSSATWILGCPGQANYSSANAALASLADYRHRLGLNATSIAWGQWGETGMVRDLARKVFGVNPFSTARGICTMEHILRNATIIGNNVMAAELSGDVKTSWVILHVRTLSNEHGEEISGNCKNNKNQFENLEQSVVSLVAKMLRFKDPSKLIDTDLSDIGMDSLMRIELRTRIHTQYNVLIDVSDSENITDIVELVTKALKEPK